jgi:BioD-like phosphotransacetylase family protein
MKSIYITSVGPHSGKTAIILALGKQLQEKNLKVGYFKPLSFQPWRIGDKLADEDSAFVKEVLKLQTEPWELSPVVVTPDFLNERLQTESSDDLLDMVVKKSKTAAKGVDVMLFEGGGSLRDGYVVGMPPHKVAEKLDTKVLAIVRFRHLVHLLDDTLAAQTRLGDTLGGVLINRVPADAMDFVTSRAIPYLESKGIPVFGVLPETRTLEALTTQELRNVLDAELLTESYNPEALIESLMVGAMTADSALHRFRKQTNKAVITGGDRSDIQLAALETSTNALVLTGNLHPSPLVVKQAEDLGVAVFLVPGSTIETVESIERIFGKTRMGQIAKLEKFESLVDQFIDLEKVYKVFGID